MFLILKQSEFSVIRCNATEILARAYPLEKRGEGREVSSRFLIKQQDAFLDLLEDRCPQVRIAAIKVCDCNFVFVLFFMFLSKVIFISFICLKFKLIVSKYFLFNLLYKNKNNNKINIHTKLIYSDYGNLYNYTINVLLCCIIFSFIKFHIYFSMFIR